MHSLSYEKTIKKESQNTRHSLPDLPPSPRLVALQSSRITTADCIDQSEAIFEQQASYTLQKQ